MKWLRASIWFLLYCAFVGAAFWLRAHLHSSGVAEIWGWDYRTFVGQIQEWRWIGYFGFRHPGLGLVCSPLVALEHVWSGAYLLVMPAVATATAWLIWKMSGWFGQLVWLSFPTTWLMAGVPESFPLAQLALVASVWDVNRRCLRHTQNCDKRTLPTPVRFAADGKDSLAAVLPVLGWSALNCAITLTNGVKPVLGWLVLNWKRLDRKILFRGGLAVVGLVLLGVGFFAARSLLTGRGMGAGLAATLSWIPAERNLPRELYGFFIRPIGFWQSFIVYPLVALGIYKEIRCLRSTPTPNTYTYPLFLLTSYFIVDVIIHLVIGWGMTEPWVFAPHWIWMLPIVAGRMVNLKS